eukprot:241569-Pelagomonas_calceolata.AAC.1
MLVHIFEYCKKRKRRVTLGRGGRHGSREEGGISNDGAGSSGAAMAAHTEVDVNNGRATRRQRLRHKE